MEDVVRGESQSRCGNCGKVCNDRDLLPLGEIHHLFERLAPGDTFPSGECRDCGALCTPFDGEFVSSVKYFDLDKACRSLGDYANERLWAKIDHAHTWGDTVMALITVEDAMRAVTRTLDDLIRASHEAIPDGWYREFYDLLAKLDKLPETTLVKISLG